ncbi:MAG: hypothetical protein HY456_02390 [Parcubacteria group bacterium]|nr:hypothetical protein [Parcubacteria group bacterium]
MRKRNRNRVATVIFLVIAISVLGGLFALPRFTNPNSSRPKASNSTDVPCLVPGVQLVQHIHPILTIYIDGAKMIVPADVGVSDICDHALHTHDDTGELHVESQDSRQYTLGDFFGVWGQPFDRPGYSLEMTVGGQPSREGANLTLRDGQHIELKYTKQND